MIDPDTLINMYQTLPQCPYLIKAKLPPKVISNHFVLLLTPLGCQRKPSALTEWYTAASHLLQALSALHSIEYAHRDVRWDNVVLVHGRSRKWDRWVLMDLEFCAPFETLFTWGEGKRYRMPGEDKCSAKTDVYMLGIMLLDVCKNSAEWDVPRRLATYLINNTPSIKEALTLVNNANSENK